MSDPITPNDVYSRWLTLNEALPLLTTDDNVISKIGQLQPNEYSGKNPSDVLNEGATLKGKLDTLRKKYDLGELQMGTVPASSDVTPADVLKYSDSVFKGIQEVVEQVNQANKDYSYHTEAVTDKEPSDVFGLVDLANRKLDLLL
jgi:hypothetical protein